MENQDVYLVGTDGPNACKIYARPGTRATVLAHGKLTKDEAEFLAAHMNNAYQCGAQAGDAQRRNAICEALGLTA